jgi:hypothetical protein
MRELNIFGWGGSILVFFVFLLVLLKIGGRKVYRKLKRLV